MPKCLRLLSFRKLEAFSEIFPKSGKSIRAYENRGL